MIEKALGVVAFDGDSSHMRNIEEAYAGPDCLAFGNNSLEPDG